MHRGTLTFTPEPNFNTSAPIPIQYTVQDPDGEPATATINLTILPVNDDPVATDDGPIATGANTPATGNVLPNDSDIDGDTLTVTGFTVAGDPATYLAGETASIDGVLIVSPLNTPSANLPLEVRRNTLGSGHAGV